MRFIDEVSGAWKLASVRLAAVAGVFAAWATSDPQGFAALAEQLPVWARPLVGLAVFATATGSRIIKAGPSEPPA